MRAAAAGRDDIVDSMSAPVVAVAKPRDGAARALSLAALLLLALPALSSMACKSDGQEDDGRRKKKASSGDEEGGTVQLPSLSSLFSGGPEKTCSKIEALMKKQQDAKKKAPPADPGKEHGKCVKDLEKMQKDDPDAYTCVETCADTMEDDEKAMQCIMTCVMNGKQFKEELKKTP